MSQFSTLATVSTVTVMALGGDAAIHLDSSYTAHPCAAIVRRGQELIGEYAQVVGVLDTLTLSNAETTARSGDTVRIESGPDAGEWRLGRKLQQTATLTTFEAVQS